MSERIYVLDYDWNELTEAEEALLAPPVTIPATCVVAKAVLRGRLTGKVSKEAGPAMIAFRAMMGSPNPPWQSSVAYAAGDKVSNDGQKQYECTTAGTSDTSTTSGPTGAGAKIVDGTVTWQYLRQVAIVLDTHDVVLREDELVDAPWSLDFEIHLRPRRRTGTAFIQGYVTTVVSGRLDSPVLPERTLLLPLEGAHAMIVGEDDEDMGELHLVYRPELDTGSITCLTYILEAIL